MGPYRPPVVPFEFISQTVIASQHIYRQMQVRYLSTVLKVLLTFQYMHALADP